MSNETQTAERAAPVINIEPEPQPLMRQQDAPRRAQVVQPIEDRPAGRAQAIERVIVRYADEHMPELFAALAAAQGAFKDLERTRTARITSAKANYAFDYETLSDVIEATKEGLAANGLAVMQFPFPSQTALTLRTMLTHAAGGWIYNDLTATIDGTDPRSVASVVTYLCRYARKAMLGVAAAYDDDAEAASQQRVDKAGGAPQPAQRVSQQKAETKPAETKPAAAGPPSPKGIVVEQGEKNGAWFVRLDTGFVAATRDKALGESLNGLAESKRRVELVATPPKTAGYAPTLTKIQVLADGAA